MQLLVAEFKNIDLKIAGAIMHCLPSASSFGVYYLNRASIAELACQCLFKKVIFATTRIEFIRIGSSTDCFSCDVGLGGQKRGCRIVLDQIHPSHQHGMEKLIPDIIPHAVEDKHDRFFLHRVPVRLEASPQKLAGQNALAILGDP